LKVGDDGDLPRVVRLKRRKEFLAAARGVRWTTPAFLLQCVARPPGNDGRIVGLGFTATRRLGGAVVRNRARRRLKEAARLVFPNGARPGHDYVIIARPAALSCPFSALVGDLEAGLAGLARKLGRAAR
jgi:ribonuclease P protein component